MRRYLIQYASMLSIAAAMTFAARWEADHVWRVLAYAGAYFLLLRLFIPRYPRLDALSEAVQGCFGRIKRGDK